MTTFDEQVEAWVEDALAAGAANFEDVLRRVPGCYPVEVQAALIRLQGRSGSDDAGRFAFRGEAQASAMPWYGEEFPIPHPLDFDWRFSQQGADRFLRHGLRLATLPGKFLFIGCPTAWFEARRRGYLQSILLDRNPALADTDAAGCITVFDAFRSPILDVEADACWCDPPWYPQETNAFVWAAASMVREGGVLLLSIAPPGARPTATEDCRAAVAYAQRCGFVLMEHLPAELEYLTPPFERLALRAAGLNGPPAAWRQGDLLIFQRAQHLLPQRPRQDATEGWVPVDMGGTTLMVSSAHPSSSNDARLISVVPGDVLDSVSRRDPRRTGVRVWTTMNRVFDCAAPGLLELLAKQVRGGHANDPPATLGDAARQNWLAARDQLVRLVHLERMDYKSVHEQPLVDGTSRRGDTGSSR